MPSVSSNYSLQIARNDHVQQWMVRCQACVEFTSSPPMKGKMRFAIRGSFAISRFISAMRVARRLVGVVESEAHPKTCFLENSCLSFACRSDRVFVTTSMKEICSNHWHYSPIEIERASELTFRQRGRHSRQQQLGPATLTRLLLHRLFHHACKSSASQSPVYLLGRSYSLRSGQKFHLVEAD